MRDVDIVGRIGGEEFGILLPGVAAGDVEIVAERIRLAIRRTSYRRAGAVTRFGQRRRRDLRARGVVRRAVPRSPTDGSMPPSRPAATASRFTTSRPATRRRPRRRNRGTQAMLH